MVTWPRNGFRICRLGKRAIGSALATPPSPLVPRTPPPAGCSDAGRERCDSENRAWLEVAPLARIGGDSGPGDRGSGSGQRPQRPQQRRRAGKCSSSAVGALVVCIRPFLSAASRMKRFNDLGADRSKEWASQAAAVTRSGCHRNIAVTCSGSHMNIVQVAHDEAAQAAAAISRSAHAAAVVVIMNTLLK